MLGARLVRVPVRRPPVIRDEELLARVDELLQAREPRHR